MQIPFHANLVSKEFPLCSIYQGKTVLLGRYDQQTSAPKQGSELADSSEGKNQPEVYYMENVLPTNKGYKSVGYKSLVTQGPSGAGNFVDIFPVRDASNNLGYVAITDAGKTYLWTKSITWTDITPAGQPTTSAVTVAYVAGTTYICYKLFGIYSINLTTKNLSVVTLTGKTASSVHGILASNNYLILFDATVVYWSSALNPLDFTPSLATGAGSGTPASILGAIITVKQTSTGMLIYSVANIVVGTFSGNVQYPWIFKEVPNSAGIEKAAHVTDMNDVGYGYAWTSAGLMKVAATGAVAVLPNVTDYLSSRLFETFDTLQGLPITEYLDKDVEVKVAFIASRFLVISYGKTSLTHSIVYDTVLNRMGKLRTTHTEIFEIIVNTEASALTYAGTKPSTYTDVTGFTCLDLVVFNNTAAKPKRTIGVMTSEGVIKMGLLDANNFASEAILVLGKYQITRSSEIALHEVLIENVDEFNDTFEALAVPSYNGKEPGTPPQALNLIAKGAFSRQYGARILGKNVSLILKGSFNIHSLVIVASQSGRR